MVVINIYNSIFLSEYYHPEAKGRYNLKRKRLNLFKNLKYKYCDF